MYQAIDEVRMQLIRPSHEVQRDVLTIKMHTILSRALQAREENKSSHPMDNILFLITTMQLSLPHASLTFAHGEDVIVIQSLVTILTCLLNSSVEGVLVNSRSNKYSTH